MADPRVRVSEQEGVRVVTLDDGKVNALSRAMLSEVEQALAGATAAGTPVVVTGNAKAFSAGLDLREVPTLDRAGLQELFRRLDAVLQALLRHPAPTVAAVAAPAIAGGAVLAMACDWRVGTPSAPLGVPELEVGIPFPPAVVDLLLARLPAASVRSTVLDPQRVSGTAAIAAGWLDEVQDDALAGAIATARRLDARDRPAYADLKQRVNGPVLSRRDSKAEAHYLDLLLRPETQDAIRRAGASTSKTSRSAGTTA